MSETLKAIPEPWPFLVAALMAALVLEILVQVFLGWPRLKIEWVDKADDAVLASIVVRITKRRPDSQVFALKITSIGGGWLGYLLLRGLMTMRVQLQVRVDRVDLVPTCESTSFCADLPTIRAEDSFHGFIVDLGRAPKRPELWHYADVRWRNISTPTREEFNVDYVFHHRCPVVKFLLNLVIWRSKAVKHLRVVGP
ncbi:hypothetical protein [Pseudoclavibacter sp. 8L]|uniref:hypothetical protein n=1 Tax=Pseudoclavibacter sp. 8L TaxID=2653162 RepID=UPI0012F21D8F|nr:hypothetical protein [Pseudoclavibacter sp. 8L]VXB74286.1 conserved hypothetical protein [Pseudoclavibacter sp. 8L]